MEWCVRVMPAAIYHRLTFLLQPNEQPGAHSGATTSIGSSASAYTSHSSGGANDDMADYKGLPVLQREIIKFILSQPERDEGGVHVGMIAKSVQGLQANPNDVRYGFVTVGLYHES